MANASLSCQCAGVLPLLPSICKIERERELWSLRNFRCRDFSLFPWSFQKRQMIDIGISIHCMMVSMNRNTGSPTAVLTAKKHLRDTARNILKSVTHPHEERRVMRNSQTPVLSSDCADADGRQRFLWNDRSPDNGLMLQFTDFSQQTGIVFRNQTAVVPSEWASYFGMDIRLAVINSSNLNTFIW